MFSSLQPHGLQYARLCPLLSPRVLRFMSIESVMLSNHLIFCHPLLLLPSVFLSIRVFSSESSIHIKWPKFWCFSFSISPSNEYSGLISFKIDSFDLLAVRGTLKSLLQHQSLKASLLWPVVLFKSVSLLILWMFNPVVESGILRFPTIIVLIFISSFGC